MKNAANFPIENISPFTLLDYPDLAACILWFAGCNMKCRYCYNPEIVYSKGKVSYKEALDFLNLRRGLLDGVVLSGGECTIQKDFIEFVKEIKSLGFKVKIDTNGSRPDIIKEVADQGLVDFVALDFKAPPVKFNFLTQSKLFESFEETLKILLQKNVDFEIRTTFHDQMLNTDDLKYMMHFASNAGYSKPYYLQHFVGEKETITDCGESASRICAEDFADMPLKLVIRN